MKVKDLLPMMGLRPAVKTYGYRVLDFDFSRDGRVQYAQWLHPREAGKKIDQESVEGLRRFLREGDAAIDVGAHTGDSTIPMALAVGPAGCVFALEPNRYVYPVLAKNAQLNATKTRIIALPFAAAAEDREIEFQYSDSGYCNGGRFTGISAWRHGHTFKLAVEGKNLAVYLKKEYPQLVPKIRYIKTDTEGCDEAVIASLSELIAQYKPFLRIEIYKRLSEEQRRSLYRLVRGLGYRLHRVLDESEYRGPLVEESDLGRWEQFDAFCVPA